MTTHKHRWGSLVNAEPTTLVCRDGGCDARLVITETVDTVDLIPEEAGR